jgi:hypothetical protein
MSLLARFLLTSFAVVGLAAIDLRPANAQTIATTDKLIVKTYSVADLVVPIDDGKATSISRDAAAKSLMQVITTSVGNKNWQDKGGAGAISYFANGMALVVRQSEENHKEVGRVLAELRRNLDRAANSDNTKRYVRVVYPIADLVTPVTDHSIMGNAKVEPPITDESKHQMGLKIVEIIANTIAKETWRDAGGRGSIHFTPFGMALVVEQSSEVQEEVEQLLASLRRLFGIQIAFEVRFIEVPGESAKKIRQLMQKGGQPLRGAGDKKEGDPSVQAAAGEGLLFTLLEAMSGDKDAVIRQAPKITLYNGQKGFIDAQHEKYPRRTDRGFRFDVQGVASADRRSVRLFLDFEHVLQAGTKENDRKVRLATTCNVPDNHSLVWYAGERSGVHLFVTATPRIVIDEEEERIFLGSNPPMPK